MDSAGRPAFKRPIETMPTQHFSRRSRSPTLASDQAVRPVVNAINSRRTLMLNTRTLIGSALAAATTLGAAAAALAGPAAQPEYSFEKCYGVVKAGQNDCQT